MARILFETDEELKRLFYSKAVKMGVTGKMLLNHWMKTFVKSNENVELVKELKGEN